MCVVELGVFEGVTTLTMRESISHHGKVWGIDPFRVGRLGISYGYSIATSEVNKSTNGIVEFVKMTSNDAVKHWGQQIDLVFIDADHSYHAVKQDWCLWSPHIRSGGFAAFHDSRTIEGRSLTTKDGPVMLVREIIENQAKEYELVDEVESITVFQKK